MMNTFSCLSITPIQLAHPGLAVATARAGGVAILDYEFCREADRDLAERNLVQLMQLTRPEQAIGLRLRADQLAGSQALCALLAEREHWLLLCAWERPLADGSLTTDRLHALLIARNRTLLFEITALEQVEQLEHAAPGSHGLVIKGHESGGWVGEDSAFILSQKVLGATARPVYVQGGIGIHTASACRVAGAAGVVLDDQLWLMPESPLDAAWRTTIAVLSGQETLALGWRLGAACRILARPGLAGAAVLQQQAEQLEIADADAPAVWNAPERIRQWQTLAQAILGWGTPETTALPLGQAAGLAASLRDQYGTTGKLVRAIMQTSLEQIKMAQTLLPLQPDAPLARAHGTRYPIVQGPMTRVSDTAAFAQAVAQAGGLPLLALAMMRHAQVVPLLRETRERLGDQPWGVGILGFVPMELREEQIAALLEVTPPFALLAGGRPDQVAQLEAHGITTYVHVPTPNLLKMFLEQGVRRFVFEGRECGGHTGPLSSFVLWDSMVTVLKNAPLKDPSDIHVLFAGGIHDARSAAMVSALAAPLVARQMRIGTLMGTAYVFTEEAVHCGAIVETFQEQALNCRRTISLETGPGHAIRCIATPFTDEFYHLRRAMNRDRVPPAAISQSLDHLTLGRLRIASKGLAHGDTGGPVPVVVDQQQQQGMYMIGQVATLRTAIGTIASLHADVSEGSTALLVGPAAGAAERSPATPADIAVIGISLILPGAQTPAAFWKNILEKVNMLREVPANRWDWRLFFDPDRKAPDKIYSKWGAFIDDVPFDPLRFGIPPKSLAAISNLQLLVLEAVRQALDDAGYGASDFDRERTSVIIGTDGSNPLRDLYMTRLVLQYIRDSVAEQTWAALPEWTEESLPGTLANVLAGRVANRFNFGGANFTVDAACASSLMALDLACQELESGRSSLVITGGADLAQSTFSYTSFSKTQAFSATGQPRTFDKEADGIVISEGLAMVVLKRLADAERDGDRVYAVIKATAASSDGKALGLTAPLSRGQQRAVNRALHKAGIAASTLELYEAHGTGTVVGDRIELETIVSRLQADQASPKSCAVGSVKTLIGHTKSTAGVAGLIKAVLALHYQVLPPHFGVNQPLEAIADPDSPIYVLDQPRPWFKHPDHPRRGSVSAFGFGGTNAHAVLEEYGGHYQQPAPGAENWPHELLVLRGADRAALLDEVRQLAAALEQGAAPRLSDLAYSYALRADERHDQVACLCLVVENLAQLKERLNLVLRYLESPAGPDPDPLLRPAPHTLLTLEAPARPPALAFVFPGQGAQHVNMGQELALYFRELREAIEQADSQLKSYFPRLLSQYIYPPRRFSPAEEKQSQAALTDTHVAQPAIGSLSLGFFQLVRRLGLEPDMVAGHSYGEFTALHAAGVLSAQDFLMLSERRGRAMAACATDGTMAVVHAAPRVVEAAIKGQAGLIVANYNAPEQVVISGVTAAVRHAVEEFKAGGVHADFLAVAGPFHSPLMAAAQAPLVETMQAMTWGAPRRRVYSNLTGQPYPAEGEMIRDQAAQHLLKPVRFLEQVERMYADGARLFVEIGPRTILTHLIRQILGTQSSTACAVDGDGLRGFLTTLGQLLVAGRAVKMTALFAGRQVQWLDLRHLVESTRQAPLPPTTWLINGAGIRPVGAPDVSPIKPILLKQPAPAAPDLRTGALAPAVTPSPASPRPAPPAPVGTAPPLPASAVLVAYQAYQDTMRQFILTQEEVMRQFLTAGLPAAPGLAPAVPVPAPPPLVTAVSQNGAGHGGADVSQEPAALDAGPPLSVEPARLETAPALARNGNNVPTRAELTETLLNVVSERTGYAPHMLGLDLDVEAELGIDSIKRIEILNTLQNILPNSITSTMRDRIETLTRVKTLNGLVDLLLPNGVSPPVPPGAGAATRPPTIELDPPPHASTNGSTADLCPRYVMRGYLQPFPNRAPITPGGLFLITQDQLGVAPRVAAALQQHGASTAILDDNILSTAEPLDRTITELRAAHGRVAGVVHLAPLARLAFPESLAAWKRQTQIQVKSLFQIVRRCAGDLHSAEQPGAILAATLLGGYFGRDEHDYPGLPAGGSACGLLKALSAEWPETVIKAVDFDDHGAPETIAQAVLTELLTPTGILEVGYPGGQRMVFHSVPKPILPPLSRNEQNKPDADWVVLITGGARGVTAEIARRFIVPGMTIFIVGLSPEPGAEDEATADIEDTGALRRFFSDHALAGGESPTPAQVEARVQKLLQQRAIRRNLASLRHLGATVAYHSVDVRDSDALGAFVQTIYQRHGRLDAVIHGAGVIADKLIEDKTLASFDYVFDTKADSAYLLSRVLDPESLQLLVLFSSTAGRFGNRGQTDYAAANELLNHMAWHLARQWRKTRVVAINWGAWDHTGMLSDGVLAQLRMQGVEPIRPPAGAQFFMDEIHYGDHWDCEVIAGIGPWSHDAPAHAESIGEQHAAATAIR